MRHTPLEHKRFIYERLHSDTRLQGVYGGRGTGKTTLLLQYLKDLARPAGAALYLSADNIKVTALGLYEIGRDFFLTGGELLAVDEIHKDPDWAQQIKNLYDEFPEARLLFSGSSTLKLQLGKADLSRRAVYHHLPALSFREYLALSRGIEQPRLSLDGLLEQHPRLAGEILAAGPVLGHFRDYLHHGAYPFFLEGQQSYHARLVNVVEKVLYQDIPTASGMKYSGVPILKKVLYELATSPPFQLNIERLAADLGVSKPTLYAYLQHLETAGLVARLLPEGAGATLTRKHGKLQLDNTNLLFAICQGLDLADPRGTIRETFFASQLRGAGYDVRAARRGDFLVAGRFRFEVGGRRKTGRQLAGADDSFVVRDDIEKGSGHVVPLWLFGFLY